MNLAKHRNNMDDFRMSHIPKTFAGFWDYPRNRTYRLLEAMVKNNRLPRLSIFEGPPGTGKTATAYLLACAQSCPEYDLGSHLGCGVCSACQSIRLGKETRDREGLIEIDCGDRSGASRAIDEIYEAKNKTYARRTWKPGDPDRDYIVFADEAQRLTSTDREALLKASEKWAGAHIVLATTDIGRLTIPGTEAETNPLLSRATLFHFTYPTIDEAARGLNQAAADEGMELTPEAAKWIANKCRCAPRDCLGELYVLSNFGPTIDLETIRFVHGEVATTVDVTTSNQEEQLAADADVY